LYLEGYLTIYLNCVQATHQDLQGVLTLELQEVSVSHLKGLSICRVQDLGFMMHPLTIKATDPQ